MKSNARDRFLIRAVFFLQPLLFGAWFPRIAEVQQSLGLGKADLSVSLMGLPCGLLVSLMVAGRISDRIGPRRLLIATMIGFLLVMPLVPMAQGKWALFGALMVAGLMTAALELAMNVSADRVERAGDRLIMAGCHGFWSLGVLAGGAVSTLLAHRGVGPGASLLVMAAVLAIPSVLATVATREMPVPPAVGAQETGGRPGWPVFAVCLFTGGIALAEGAMADWAAVYLADSFGAAASSAGGGYLVFAFAVAFGRFNGDWIRARFEMAKAARLFVLTAIAGLAILVLAPNIAVACIGFAMLGLGVSSGFPLGVTVVASLPGRSAAANVGLLSQVALLGFLISPPIIGVIAETHGMRIGLAMVGFALLLSLAMSREMGRPPMATVPQT